MSAIGVTKSKLADQRFVIYGAGSAGLGIAHQLRDALVQLDNVPRDEANKSFWLLDKHGLVKESLQASNLVRPALQDFVRPDSEWTGLQIHGVDSESGKGEVGLLDVIKKVKPTVLIGCSTHPGAFTEEVVKEMAKGTERPIILPLSNPSRLVEVDPAKANEWTNGKALLATGSPFPPAKMPNGKDYMYVASNAYGWSST